MEGDKYTATIGLEIHAELKTRTKMFCDSKNDPDEKRPNVNVCPICMGHPGTLPVINKEAVKHVLKVGIAVGGNLAYDFTEFDRKNYFYPDIPKGYQISQYKFPLVKGGELRGVKLTRIHLEEDTARSSHENGDHSLVDFNRAGVPLMELVTEPVIRTGKEASDFAKELQLLLRYLGAGEANMEKGEMRVEANISVSDSDKLGTKVEVKNLNSFRAVEKAIAYEIERHIGLLESGGKIIQETRGWDDAKGKTFSQRVKEDSHDYRYFPDPDLPKLVLKDVPELSVEVLKKEMSELPWQRRERYVKDIGLKAEDAEQFIQYLPLCGYFETVSASVGNDRKLALLAANYIGSDYVGLLRKAGADLDSEKDVSKVPPEAFGKLISMAGAGKISSRAAKDILAIMFEKGGDPEKIAEENDLMQKSDESTLRAVAEKIVSSNPKVAADFKAGKQAALQFLVGQGMKETRGSANPEILRQIFVSVLSAN